jgi:hypothetical protein
MYTNIPKMDTVNIINNILKNNPAINKNNREEIVHTLQVIIEQNYFQIDQQYYKQSVTLRKIAIRIFTAENTSTGKINAPFANYEIFYSGTPIVFEFILSSVVKSCNGVSFETARYFWGTYTLHLQGRRVDQARNQRKLASYFCWFLCWPTLMRYNTL